MREKIVIAGACRTPVGKFGGRLKSVKAQELLRACFRGTIERTGVKMGDIDSAVASTCTHSPDAMNVARFSLLLSGLPDEQADAYSKGGCLSDEFAARSSAINIPAFTVSRNCGSGVQAVVSAVHEIVAGDSKVILVGGTESMSNSPMLLERSSTGYKMRDSVLVDSLSHGLRDPLTGQLMGRISENTVSKWGISREDQDHFAVRSHQRAYNAVTHGKFEAQIVPVKSVEKNAFGDIREQVVYEDEGPIDKLAVSRLASLRPCFKNDGTITPGNSCSINDGAASFLVVTDERAQELEVQPDAEIVGYGVAACHPSFMGEGPILAIPKALKMAGLTEGEVDFFEINEAFAAVVLATQRQFQIPDHRLNIYGGAIALGHPVGATGAILVTKAVNILKDFEGRYALISLCIGNGQGIALVIKKYV